MSCVPRYTCSVIMSVIGLESWNLLHIENFSLALIFLEAVKSDILKQFNDTVINPCTIIYRLSTFNEYSVVELHAL